MININSKAEGCMSGVTREKLNAELVYLQEAKMQRFSQVPYARVEQIFQTLAESKKEPLALEEKEIYCSVRGVLKEACQTKMPFRVFSFVKGCIKGGRELPSTLEASFRSLKIPLPNKAAEKQQRKESLAKLKQQLIDLSHSHEKELSIIERLLWVHGTNSALLPLLPYNDFTLMCTGSLLDDGIAPMCGELSQGGMDACGVNQSSISAETVRALNRAWEYATTVSSSFNPKKYAEGEQLFIRNLEILERLSPNELAWDQCIIPLIRLKQWSPELFAQLKEKYAQRVQNVILGATRNLFFREAMILDALSIPDEVLQLAKVDPATRKELEERFPGELGFVGNNTFADALDSKYGTDPFRYFSYNANFGDYSFIKAMNWDSVLRSVLALRFFPSEYLLGLEDPDDDLDKLILARLKRDFGDPVNVELYLQKKVKEKIEKRIESKRLSSASRLLRLKNIFEKDRGVRIPEEQKEWITSPFPILLGSTKAKSFFLNSERETNFFSAKWGEEIDVIFVREGDLKKMTGWLQEQGLDEKVQVHSAEILSPLFAIPLYHAPGDVAGENTVLSSADYRYMNKHIQDCVHLYQKPFPNGTPRVYHGVVHAARAALFTAVITEMYLAQGHSLFASAKNLPIAGFLHETGRESDFGEDLWDKESGQICEKYSTDELKLTNEEAQALSRGIAEKDAEPAFSLEQKIIHDADCMEIFRCFLNSPEAFDQEKLWLFKDQLPRPILDLFVSEAKSLIQLTEKPEIKQFLQTSSDPLSALVQIMNFKEKHQFLSAHTRGARDHFCMPSEYLLTPEVETAIAQALAK